MHAAILIFSLHFRRRCLPHSTHMIHYAQARVILAHIIPPNSCSVQGSIATVLEQSGYRLAI